MSPETVLAVSLSLNAVLGFGYRVYRLTKRGPLADVIGQAILGLLLIALAVAAAAGQGWTRWPALAYGAVFALLVMPVWTLAVLIPSRPALPDYLFAGVYWLALVAVVVAALAI